MTVLSRSIRGGSVLVAVLAFAAAGRGLAKAAPAGGAIGFESDEAASVSVVLTVSGGATPLGAYRATIAYDHAALSLQAVSPSGGNELGTRLTVDESPGLVSLASTNALVADAPVGPVQVARLDFDVIGAPGELATVELRALELFGTRHEKIQLDSLHPFDRIAFLVGQEAKPPVAAGPAKPATWDELKKQFKEKSKEWKPLVDQLADKKKALDNAKTDEETRKLLGEIGELTNKLTALVEPFLKSGLKGLLTGDKELEPFLVNLDSFKVVAAPFITPGRLGDTSVATKTIRLKVVPHPKLPRTALDDAESFFATGFHEFVHSTQPATAGREDPLFYAEELWVEDQENRFRAKFSLPQTARVAGEEWNYTLTWKVANGYLVKSGKTYTTTDKGKKVADCYFKNLASSGWRWQSQPTDFEGAMFYNQEAWKTEKTKHKTKAGNEFTVIVATQAPYFGQGGYDPKNPCDR